MGEEGVALADGGGDSEREALRASLFGTLPGVGGSNSSLGLAGNPHTPSPHPQERLGGWTPADTALWGRRGLCALPGFSVLLKGTQLAPKWLVDDGREEGKPRDPWFSPQVAVWAVPSGLLECWSWGTHIAQIQELGLVGQAEEGGADDKVDLWEGHCSAPRGGGGRGPSGSGSPAPHPQLPLPAGWAAERPVGRAAP